MGLSKRREQREQERDYSSVNLACRREESRESKREEGIIPIVEGNGFVEEKRARERERGWRVTFRAREMSRSDRERKYYF